MDNTPEAAAPATEAPVTNSNPAPDAPAQAPAPAPTEAPSSDMQGFTSEQLTEMKKFMDANGGYDKAFKTFKERISNPAPEQPKAQEQPAQPTMTIEEQMQKLQTPAGYMTPQEFIAQQYYNSLANKEEYASIADQIRSGAMFKEMAKFGIRPMDQNGNLNDVQVREFFDLYAKTVPAKPAVDPAAAAAPTVDYIPTNQGKIDNAQQAMQILAQSASLKEKGLAEHPDIEAAKTFLKNAWNGNAKK